MKALHRNFLLASACLFAGLGAAAADYRPVSSDMLFTGEKHAADLVFVGRHRVLAPRMAGPRLISMAWRTGLAWPSQPTRLYDKTTLTS